MSGGPGLGDPVRSAQVVPATSVSRLVGRADLYNADLPTATLVVDLRNVPAAPSGHHYEVWVLRPGDHSEMEAIGAFVPHDGRARLELRLPGPGTYVALDISVQANGGPPEHSGTSIAGASLQ